MVYISEFMLAGKVIMVERKVSAKGNEYTRIGIQTGTRAGDRAWLNMSNEWAAGAEKGQQAMVEVRFDSVAGRLRPTDAPTFAVEEKLVVTAAA